MNDFIDIGIDFGAENIVCIAIGHDKKGRIDYKIVNLDYSSFSLKNYVGLRKNDNTVDIGSKVKNYFAHGDTEEYSLIGGRYKNRIDNNTQYQDIITLALTEVLNKLEKFDFSPLLSGKLRNLTVGIPESWSNFNKKLYLKTLNLWKHGEIFLLSEPSAATIALHKKSLEDISDKINMIIDIGASTSDISFSSYNESTKSLEIFNKSHRSNYSGYYFDLIFLAHILLDESNKNAYIEIIDRITRIKVRTIDQLVSYLKENISLFSHLIVEVELIKENHINELIKFNKKRLIDTGKKTPLSVNKNNYLNALKYYSSKFSVELNSIINDFRLEEKIIDSDKINIMLCGGGSSLYNLDLSLKELINPAYYNEVISPAKENNNYDITIALGLAYFSQDNNIINSKIDCDIELGFKIEESENREYFKIIEKESLIPFKSYKSFTSILKDEYDLKLSIDTNKITFPIRIIKNDVLEHEITFEINDYKENTLFDILFNVINKILVIKLKSLENNNEYKKYLFL